MDDRYPPSTEPAHSTPWRDLLFDPAANWLGRIDRMARERFRDGLLAEQAAAYVFEQLTDANTRVFDHYERLSSPAGFLVTVIVHLLEDFARRRFGRQRPPAWLQAMGAQWLRLYALLCQQRLEKETIVGLLSSDAQAERVRDMIGVIRARIPDCGQRVREQSWDEGQGLGSVELGARARTSLDHGEASLVAEQRAVLLEVLGGLLREPSATRAPAGHTPEAAAARRLAARLDVVAGGLRLDDDARFALRLVCQEGLSYAAAARALGVPEQRVRRAFHLGIETIREALERGGLNLSQLRDLADE